MTPPVPAPLILPEPPPPPPKPTFQAVLRGLDEITRATRDLAHDLDVTLHHTCARCERGERAPTGHCWPRAKKAA
jgi:hypothetical protein